MDLRVVNVVPAGGRLYLSKEGYGDAPDVKESLRGFRVVTSDDFILVQCIEEDRADGVEFRVFEFDREPPEAVRQVADGWPQTVRGI